MSGPIPARDQRLLCTRSGSVCANPKCRKELVIALTKEGDRESTVAEMAHIKGEKPTAPRYDPNMTDPQRNAYSNLIFLCRACHKEIDDQPKKYTVEILHEMKKNHEEWVKETLRSNIINVTFAELEVITKYLNSNQIEADESYTLIPPKEKIQKNELSQLTERLITMGLTQVKYVAKFIENFPDIEFGTRLRNGFISEYEKIRGEQGLKGDDLFDELVQFASGGSGNGKLRAAGLSVLVYLFEKCEVFEK